jgi:hypothetical protein
MLAAENTNHFLGAGADGNRSPPALFGCAFGRATGFSDSSMLLSAAVLHPTTGHAPINAATNNKRRMPKPL